MRTIKFDVGENFSIGKNGVKTLMSGKIFQDEKNF